MLNIRTYIEVSALIIFMVSGIFLVFAINKDTNQCLKNPIQYGVERLSSSNNKDIICTCFSPNDIDGIITFNASISKV